MEGKGDALRFTKVEMIHIVKSYLEVRGRYGNGRGPQRALLTQYRRMGRQQKIPSPSI
jgi:hypothetical protein